jgi:hypothetical protein
MYNVRIKIRNNKIKINKLESSALPLAHSSSSPSVIVRAAMGASETLHTTNITEMGTAPADHLVTASILEHPSLAIIAGLHSHLCEHGLVILKLLAGLTNVGILETLGAIRLSTILTMENIAHGLIQLIIITISSLADGNLVNIALHEVLALELPQLSSHLWAQHKLDASLLIDLGWAVHNWASHGEVLLDDANGAIIQHTILTEDVLAVLQSDQGIVVLVVQLIIADSAESVINLGDNVLIDRALLLSLEWSSIVMINHLNLLLKDIDHLLLLLLLSLLLLTISDCQSDWLGLDLLSLYLLLLHHEGDKVFNVGKVEVVVQFRLGNKNLGWLQINSGLLVSDQHVCLGRKWLGLDVYMYLCLVN